MKKMTKRILMASLLVASMTSTLATAAIQLPTLITLYNSETTLGGGGSTIAVLRQEPRRAELFMCSKKYTGSPKDYNAVEAFFNEGLSEGIKNRTNCIEYKTLSNAKYLINKTSITGFSGEALRYVYTAAGSTQYIAGLFSDVATWTIDVNDGLGISTSDDIVVVGARVNHDRLDNPTISTIRDSFKFSGMAKIQLSEIGK